MSIRVVAQVFEHSQHSGTDLLVLIALADFSDDSGHSYPAVSTLAHKCRMKERNMRLILHRLEQSGELIVYRNAGPSGANRYRIQLAPLQSSAPPLQSSAPPPLQSSTATPVEDCRDPLQSSTAKPSLNRQEPSEDSGSAQRANPATPPRFDGLNEDELNGRAVVQLSDSFALHLQWGKDAEALGWKPSEIKREAERFRQYWTAGKGKGTRRGVKGWRQAWSNWLARAAEHRR